MASMQFQACSNAFLKRTGKNPTTTTPLKQSFYKQGSQKTNAEILDKYSVLKIILKASLHPHQNTFFKKAKGKPLR